MAGQFKERLRLALDVFDIHTVDRLFEDISDAEENGYILTATEERLCERLLVCFEMYHRTSAAIDT